MEQSRLFDPQLPEIALWESALCLDSTEPPPYYPSKPDGLPIALRIKASAPTSVDSIRTEARTSRKSFWQSHSG